MGFTNRTVIEVSDRALAGVEGETLRASRQQRIDSLRASGALDLKDGEMVADDPVLTCQCPCGCTNQAHESEMDDDGTTIRCPECAATAEG